MRELANPTCEALSRTNPDINPSTIYLFLTLLPPGVDVSYLGALVTCLKTARTLGLIEASGKFSSMGPSDVSTRELWGGLVPVELLQKCLCNIDDQVSWVLTNSGGFDPLLVLLV